MRQFLLFISTLCISISCTNKDAFSIVDTWGLAAMYTTDGNNTVVWDSFNDASMILKFNSNGTYSNTTNNIITINGIYTFKDYTLICKLNTEGTYTTTYVNIINNNEIILTTIKGSKTTVQTFIRL